MSESAPPGDDPPLQPGAVIGILGGGQLARMLAMAAARLGYRTVVLDPDPIAPAAQVCNDHVVSAYDDPQGLARLAEIADVVTYEFENVPEDAVEILLPRVDVRPNVRALAVAQDRLAEKTFLNQAGIPTAAFHLVDSQADLVAAVDQLGGRAIVKTRRLGYDGKGQLRIEGEIPADGFEQLGSVPCIAEELVDFTDEISVIGVRSATGEVVCFDPARNVHINGILSTSTVPSGLGPDIERRAADATTALLQELRYVGALGLELFVLPTGELLANEFAPRVHNSGHWTEVACVVSQFEQHVRAVAGLPLVDPGRHADCVMTNLIGADVARLPELIRQTDTMVHLYGKRDVRSDRKMGHITQIRRIS